MTSTANPTLPLRRVGIVGAGVMGAGIAQLCLQKGFKVSLYDESPEASCKAAGRIKKGIEDAATRGKIASGEIERALNSISYAKSLEELSGAELVIEAIAEDLPAKKSLFERLGRIVPSSMLATNTSSLSVAEIAAGAASPERVLGLHFFNPPVATKLVEVIRAPRTSGEVFKAARDFVAALGKTPIQAKDKPGFIVNRVMRPYYLACQRLVSKRCPPALLDRMARELGEVPMGPFELMDLIGLDVNLAITKVIYESLGRPERLKPQPLQEALVAQGHWGRKTGRGFYLYADGKRMGENPEALSRLSELGPPPEEAWEKTIGAVVLEAQLAHDTGIASREDIDVAIKLAMNFPKGPFEWRPRAAKTAP